MNNLTPDYLREKLPAHRIQRGRNTFPNQFHEILPRTDRYKNSFYPNAIFSWNNIIRRLNGNLTYDRLKSFLLKSTRPIPKSIYGIHDPVGLRYLFQLSPLKCHKFFIFSTKVITLISILCFYV